MAADATIVAIFVGRITDGAGSPEREIVDRDVIRPAAVFGARDHDDPDEPMVCFQAGQ
jgi:hypothetical protein